MVVTYGDFFFLSLVPIILQAGAAVYLWKIHKYIGWEMTGLLAGVNGVLLVYDIVISYLILVPPRGPDGRVRGPEQVTLWGVFIGFIMPLANAALHFVLQRRLVRGLVPS